MAHNGKNNLRYAIVSRNSWLIMVRIISDIQPYQGLMAHNGKNYLRFLTLSRNSWLIMVRIITGAQPYQGTHGT